MFVSEAILRKTISTEEKPLRHIYKQTRKNYNTQTHTIRSHIIYQELEVMTNNYFPIKHFLLFQSNLNIVN